MKSGSAIARKQIVKKIGFLAAVIGSAWGVEIGANPAGDANGWYKSASDSAITESGDGVRWSPVKKPTTIHKYFPAVDFSSGKKIVFTMNWESDGIDNEDSNRELQCANANPTGQGKGISDKYLRCLAGTGDFRIGLFQSQEKVGNESCEGNSKKTNCKNGNSIERDFNDYRGFQFRIHPHLSKDFNNSEPRLKEPKDDGESESHINLNLWSRIEEGENGLMSDECQAVDHCGFSKSDDWGTQPVSWGPNMPFGEARELKVEIERKSDDHYEVFVTLNGNRSPLLKGRFKSDFRPSELDTIAVTYTNSSRRFEYVEITNFKVNGEGGSTTPPSNTLVTDIQAESRRIYEFHENVRAGSAIYVDRDYQFTDLGLYEGYDYIRTSNSDDGIVNDAFLRFTLAERADVAVLFDERSSRVPAWLETWSRTGNVVRTNDTSFDVYVRTLNAGTHSFGGNERSNTGAKSMYGVLVNAAAPAPTSTPTPQPTSPPEPSTQGPGLGNVNFSSSELFEQISLIKSPDGHGNVAMVNGYLMVIYSSDGGGSSTDGGIEFWDVSNPRSPKMVKRYDNRDTHGLREAHGFGLSNGYNGDVLVAQAAEGIQFWDVSDPSNSIELISYMNLQDISLIDYGGNWWTFWQAPYVYVAGTKGGLYIVDATDPNNPILANRLSTREVGDMNPGVVYAVGNLLVLMENKGRKYSTLDISDPVNPKLLDTFSGEKGYSHLFAAGKIFNSGSDSPQQMHAYNVNHDGRISKHSSVGAGLGGGGYGSYQDGHFFSGFSEQIAKINVSEKRMVGTGSSGISGRDEDFGMVLGNLVFAGDDHGKGSALIPHQRGADITPPEVTWIHPRNGASNQARTSRVGVSMSDNIDLNSISNSTFIVRPVGGNALNGKYSVQFGLVNFSSDQPLAANTEYEVVIDQLEDLVGNKSRRFVSRFSTGASSSVPEPTPGDVVNGINRSYDVENIANGSEIYGDRDYEINGSLPAALNGLTMIVTDNDDKNQSGDSFLTFNLEDDSTVYVLYDDRVSHSDIPNWLDNWNQTSMRVKTTDGDRRVYRKDFPQGRVELGGNNPAKSMYTVLIEKHVKQVVAPRCSLPIFDPALIGESVTLRAETVEGSSPLSYRWEFNDGSASISQQNVSKSFAFAGRFSVSLTVSNDVGSAACTSTQIVHEALSSNPATSSSSIVVSADNAVNVNPDNNTVSKVSNAGQKLWEVTVGKNPKSIVVGPDNHLWVTNKDSATISVIRLDNGNRVRTISLPQASQPHGVVKGRSNHVYVALEATKELLKLNSSGSIVSRVQLPAAARAIAINGSETKLLAARFISPATHAEVYDVNPASMSLQRTIQLANDPGPDTEASGRGVPNYLSNIQISPSGKLAIVPSKKDNVSRGQFRDGQDLTFESRTRTIVSSINLETNEEDLFSRIDINDRDMAQAAVFSPLGDVFFVALQGSNTIEVFDSNTLDRLSSIGVERAPQGLTLNADGTKLFVHNFLSRSVSVINVEDLITGESNNITIERNVSVVNNELLDANVLNGKRIFYNANDRRMNRDGYISCASCHLDGGSDGQVWDFTQAGEGLRNTISLVGKGGTSLGNVHWTANFDEIHDFENDIRLGFGGSGFLTDAQFNDTRTPLGARKAGLNNDLDDLARYVASLDKVPNSPHRQPNGNLTSSAQAGKTTFMEIGCQSCHAGSGFTDQEKHDVGTIKASSGLGVGESLAGVGFKTPTLKGVWATAPYLHDGSAATLLEVISNPNHGNAAGLTTTQKTELVDYLLQIDERENGDTGSNPDIPPSVPAYDDVRYRFEKNYKDTSGSDLHAKKGNRSSFSTIEKEGGYALKLDGDENDYVSLPTVLADTNDFTFAAWVRWHGGDSWQRIFSMGRDRDNVMFLSVADSSGKPRFRIEKENQKQELRPNIAFQEKRYYHVAITLKGDVATMYVDGKRVASKSGVQFNPEDLGVTHVWLGRSIFNDPYFNGRMDDVRFYSRALSTTEINKLRN